MDGIGIKRSKGATHPVLHQKNSLSVKANACTPLCPVRALVYKGKER